VSSLYVFYFSLIILETIASSVRAGSQYPWSVTRELGYLTSSLPSPPFPWQDSEKGTAKALR